MPTIGVAIPVPEPYGSMLREKRGEFGDPMADTVPSHVTLMAPTDVKVTALSAVCDALELASSSLSSFPMRLSGTGTFRPVSPVVFIAVIQGISYIEMLARYVRTALDVEEPEFPFHPHVTVAHNIDDSLLDRAYDELHNFECQFVVDAFALYQHENGAGWVPQRTFALGPQ